MKGFFSEKRKINKTINRHMHAFYTSIKMPLRSTVSCHGKEQKKKKKGREGKLLLYHTSFEFS